MEENRGPQSDAHSNYEKLEGTDVQRLVNDEIGIGSEKETPVVKTANAVWGGVSTKQEVVIDLRLGMNQRDAIVKG